MSLKTITAIAIFASLIAFSTNSAQSTNDSEKSSTTDDKTNSAATNTATTNDSPAAANDDASKVADSKKSGTPQDVKTNKDDTFIPSESISEDLAVSFPIDI